MCNRALHHHQFLHRLKLFWLHIVADTTLEIHLLKVFASKSVNHPVRIFKRYMFLLQHFRCKEKIPIISSIGY